MKKITIDNETGIVTIKGAQYRTGDVVEVNDDVAESLVEDGRAIMGEKKVKKDDKKKEVKDSETKEQKDGTTKSAVKK